MKSAPFLLLAASSLALAACGERAPEGATAIFATRIYTAPDAPAIDDGVILLQEDRVLAVGPRDSVATRGAERLERCDAGVIAAGFHNSHVHFTEPKFADAATRPAAELSSAMESMLTRYGFTSVVDATSGVANATALRERVARGEVAGPRILTAGMALYPANGIPFYLLDMPPEFLAKLPQPATVESALEAVKSNLDAGADATKLFLMTPVPGGKVAFMDPEIARAAADETHRRGLPVLAHPTDIEGIELAIEAGVDVLVHTTIGRGRTVWEPALIEQMLAGNIAVIPTLKLWTWELRRAGVPENVVELASGDAVEQVKAYHAAGGAVLFGTDVGYMSDYDPTDEYRLMARALTPMQILASLTTAPSGRWNGGAGGRIATGEAADLVVLAADPAGDPANFARVRCTIRSGRLLYAMKEATG
jgi:imidazolonepropionase-like amidohydrolase